ncbi:MAG: hypothetical protein AAF481_12940 [Acidobacteriota bacterium]
MTAVNLVLAWSQMLRTLMREKRRSGRSVEQQLGWSSGYLSQVLGSGSPALKVSHVQDILGALEVAPEEFFARLFGPTTVEPAPLPRSDDGFPAAADGGAPPPSLRLEQIEQLVDRRIAEERDLRRQELARVKSLVDRALQRSRDRSPVDLDRVQALVGEALTTELRRLEAERERPRKRGDR